MARLIRIAIASISVSLLMVAAAPARAEVEILSETAFVSRHSIVIAADHAAVWKALIAPHRWWNKDHTWSGDADNLYLDAQATGCFCEKLPRPPSSPADQRMGSVEHMHVIYADPEAGFLRMMGGLGPLQGEAASAVMTVRLIGVDGGTRIEVEYLVGGLLRMPASRIAGPVDTVVGEQFTRLAALFVPTAAKPE